MSNFFRYLISSKIYKQISFQYWKVSLNSSLQTIVCSVIDIKIDSNCKRKNVFMQILSAWKLHHSCLVFGWKSWLVVQDSSATMKLRKHLLLHGYFSGNTFSKAFSSRRNSDFSAFNIVKVWKASWHMYFLSKWI